MIEVKEMCPGSSYKALYDGALLLDVREKDEYDKVHFEAPHILHIPYSELDERFAEIPRNQPVIVASSVGERSRTGAYFLLNNGYTEVANLKGGMAKWLHKQYPVQGDKYAEVSAPSGCCSPAESKKAAKESEKSTSCCEGQEQKSEKSSSCCGGKEQKSEKSSSCC